jgi:hypothetical protein
MVKRQAIVLAQTLDIPHLKTAEFRRSKARTDWHQIAVGKYVPINKRWPSPAIDSGVGNSVVQEYATRPQQVPSSTEVLRQERFTNMLKHAHAHNLVILLVMINVAVV